MKKVKVLAAKEGTMLFSRTKNEHYLVMETGWRYKMYCIETQLYFDMTKDALIWEINNNRIRIAA